MNNAALETIGFQNSQLRSPIPFDASAVATEDSGLLTDRHKVRALELGITEDLPYQPQASGFGYSAAGTARRLRELLEDPETFKTYAFISALLSPDAGKQFRRLIHHQTFRTTHFKRTGRAIKHSYDFNLEQHAECLEETARENWWYPNATIDNIQSTKPFAPPQWAGEPRPPDAETVEFLLSVSCPLWAGDYARLVSEFGYDPMAAWTSIPHPNRLPRSDRRRKGVRPHLSAQEGDEAERDSASIAQPFPYAAALSRRTTQGGKFKRRDVQAIVGQMRVDHPTRRAVFKVVFARLPVKVVAQAYGIPWTVLKNHAQRIRAKLRSSEIANV